MAHSPRFRTIAARYPAVIVVVALVILLVSWSLMFKPRRPTVRHVYFKDLQSGHLFTAPADQLPPIEAPAGGQAALAHVFSCGSCADERERFVGYLQKNTDEFNQAVQSDAEVTPQLATTGQLLSDEAGQTWIPAMSPQGRKLVQTVHAQCSDKRATVCNP